MRVEIQAANLGLTPPLREYINKKIGSLEKFLRRYSPESLLAEVEVRRSTRHHRHGQVYHVDVNLVLPGGLIRAVHDDADARAAIDVVRKKLQREISKFKEIHK